MSKLLNTYHNLKKQDSQTIYLFKSGIFYLALEDDARLLSNELQLKLTSLNNESIKCGFPCSSFDKYKLRLNNLNKNFKIIDKDTIFDATTYQNNKEIQKLINDIKKIDINKLSITEAFSLLEKLQHTINDYDN